MNYQCTLQKLHQIAGNWTHFGNLLAGTRQPVGVKVKIMSKCVYLYYILVENKYPDFKIWLLETWNCGCF